MRSGFFVDAARTDRAMQICKLNSGGQIPVIGLGTWKTGGDDARRAVQHAIESGYRHIDCARIYENEADVGRALEFCLRNSTVGRDDLWVTSKLWNDAHAPADVKPALQSSLDDLQLDYLDLYLIHWPVAHRPGVVRPEDGNGFLSLEDLPLPDTWLALQECREQGLCHHIGVSNFSVGKLQHLIDRTGLVPSVNQVECHPFLAQRELLDYCNRQGILLTAYSPLGSGDRPDAMKHANEPSLLQHPEVVAVANEADTTPAVVLLAWAVGRGTPVIPKSANPERILENLAAGQLRLNPDQMARLDQLDRDYRYVDGTFWEMPGSPYTVAGLWDE